MILDTKVKSKDLTQYNDSTVIKRNGYIPINYGNNFIDKNDEVNLSSELELKDGLLSVDIKIDFTYSVF